MIQILDKPETTFGDGVEPIRRIDMTQMDAESIAVMLENSRDGFYSNKELAPIREYSTNARDAHIQAKIPTRPIEVTLPSQMAPELRIRDFGKGLSIEQLEDIYFRYWKSTKRGSNEVNGCLGIGAKSAFAYAPSYTVVSWCGGMKTIATGQKSGYADIIFNEANTANEPDGIEIVIPIQQKDIAKFIHEAMEFFKYWDVRPIFHNVEADTLKTAFNIMDTEPFISGDGWAVRPAGYGGGESKAVMGFVPYSIDWEQIKNSLAPEVAHKISGIFDFLRENLTALYFPMGSLSFTPNRESLQYNDMTVKALGDRLVAIFDSLLNLITSKVADAPSIWEAKIRYNRIFRKELDGFEKNEMYGGNLTTLENILRNRVLWRGITIANGYFEDLDQWDATTGKAIDRYNKHDGWEGILETYVKDEERTGIKTASKGGRRRRYRYGSDSKIICSPRSMVIIQDLPGAAADAKALAHWFLYKAKGDIQQVYVLDLHDANVKAAFFRQYAFDTVPVSYVSVNAMLIKAYRKSIRTPRQSTGSGIPRESRPIYCPYITIENRRSGNYVSNPAWNYENVNARGVEGDNNYFVVYSKNSFTYGLREIDHENANAFWQAIYDLALLCGENVPKVYGIHPKSAEAVWFKEAVEDGSWTNIADWVAEHADILPKDAIKKVNAYLSVTTNRVGTVTANLLAPNLVNPDGVLGKYCKEVADYSNYLTVRELPRWLNLDGYNYDEADTEVFAKMNAELKAKYPLMFRIGSDWQTIGNANPNDRHHTLSADMAKELAEYVNLVDVYGAKDEPVAPAVETPAEAVEAGA